MRAPLFTVTVTESPVPRVSSRMAPSRTRAWRCARAKPCERTRRFATGRDMQTSVRVRVAQGEQPYFPQNTYLGEVELSGLRPAPRGEVTVAVTFEVDADGSLRIRARDVQTGQEARATLQLVGVADESSVVMMINRFAQQNVGGGGPPQ